MSSQTRSLPQPPTPHRCQLAGISPAQFLKQTGRVANVLAGEILPLFLLVGDDAAHPLRDQLILGVEVPVEGHLVGLRRLGDRFDADAADALLVEQVPRRHQNPLANGHSRPALRPRLRAVAVNICLHGDLFYPTLTKMLPTGNIGVLLKCYRSVTYYKSVRSATASCSSPPRSRAT